MFFVDFLLALVVALLLTLVFVPALGWRVPRYERAGTGAAALFFFLVLLLAAWVGGAWLQLGPAVDGVYWLGFVVMGLLVALLLAAAAPPRRDELASGDAAALDADAAGLGFAWAGIFFWLLVVFLVAGLVAAYV